MTKTSFTPKISFITPSVGDQAPAVAPPQDSAGKDSYLSATPNAFDGLVAGKKTKADAIDGGVLNDMYNAETNQTTTVRNDYYSQNQAVIGNLMFGEVIEKPPQDYLNNIPYVPDLYKEVIGSTDQFHDNMQAVVERYAGLEKLIVSMYSQVDEALKPQNMSQFQASELRSLQAYRSKLDETLARCREQLSLSQGYLRDQLSREEADAKAAAADPST